MQPPNQPKPKPKRRRYTRWLLTLLALLTTVGYTDERRIDVHNPLSDTNKILAIIPWRIPGNNGGYINQWLYTWQDNETVIYGVCNIKRNCRLMRQRVRGNSPSAAQAVPHIPLLHNLSHLSVSPDGKLLLTVSYDKEDDAEYTIFALDTGAVKQKYLRRTDFMTWKQDSRSFFGRDMLTENIIQYDVDRHQTKSYPFNPQLSKYCVVFSPGEYFSTNVAPPPTPLRLERGSIVTGKSQVRIVPQYSSTEIDNIVSASPQGDKLLPNLPLVMS